MTEMKRCSHCGKTLNMNMFGKYQQSHDGLQRWCKSCKAYYDHKRYQLKHTEIVEQQREYRHRVGLCQPYTENTKCATYLGVHVAERALGNFFDTIKQMPMNNPGYDFLCGRGLKIDAKSSCQQKNGSWLFHIRQNTTADWFLLLAFSDRKNLNPLRVWLVPGNLVNHLSGLRISPGPIGLAKWAKYERPLDRVETCCAKMASKK